MRMLDFHTENVTNTQETVYAKNCREGSRGLSVVFQLDDRLKEQYLGRSFQSLGSRPTACASYPSLVSTDVYFPWLPGYLIFIAASRTLISLNFFFLISLILIPNQVPQYCSNLTTQPQVYNPRLTYSESCPHLMICH